MGVAFNHVIVHTLLADHEQTAFNIVLTTDGVVDVVGQKRCSLEDTINTVSLQY